MSTLNYLVKGQKYYSNILIRFKNGRKFDYTASTDLKIDPKNWSQAKQKIKNTAGDKTKDAINNHLTELKKYILDEFNLDNATGTYIDKQWLQQKIANHFNRPINEEATDEIYFVDFTDTFIKKAPTRLIKGKNKPVSSSTITKYNSLLKKLKAYEIHTKTKIKFTDLGLTFYENFVHFLKVEETISTNTVGKYISTLKAIAREALLKGLPVNKEINHPNFFVPTEKSKDIYLSNTEINTIYKHNFKGDEKLENARDLFIIGLRTGLRISDFLRLKHTNIKDGYIEIETQKTEQEVVIPMHPQVKEILEKRNGFPRQISDQKFNLYIKDVCEEAKLTQMVSGSKIDKETNRKKEGTYPKYELVTSHICRRSFASNLYGNLPNLAIMGITGHKTETQFLRYIKVTSKENANKLKEYWAKQKVEKGFEEVNLKIVK
ncbi:site-specific integrase [Lutibacter sp. B1]|uniref:site-specific integrase n=1 Tax=Lutibacter sp. B1 TaxID=2725996 RepID=UPI0014570C25|nr:site-specific integrase [Lutibacter sp. B1]NLP59232.1 site-specific integrase [Lutibacter sp. B1]